MLNELFLIQNQIAESVTQHFKRYLYRQINWSQRLIIITGARGTGKTFMVMQHYLDKYKDFKKCLYFSADNPLVLKNGIYQTAAEYFKYYGECIIIDEVHKQKNWSIDIKALYDAYPDKRLIVLGSSTLNILFEKGDLSRRAVSYSLNSLSFREYLEIKYRQEVPRYGLKQVLDGHVEIAAAINSNFKTILGDFNQFLMSGSYPFFLEYPENDYFKVLANVLDKVIYEDIGTLKSLKSISSLKLKKLLGFIAISKIPLFNIESLKIEIGVSKDTLYEYFDLLDRAGIVRIVRTESLNLRAFKNSKVLFQSPNIYFTIAHELWKSDPQKGNIREAFFASQIGACFTLFSATDPDIDFLIPDKDNKIQIEVGGKSKKKKRGQRATNQYIFKDGIEIGGGNTIPLYLAGFLY